MTNNTYNSTAFIPEEVEKGLHLKLIKHLLEESQDLEKSYNDIHITSDGYCVIIEWIQVPYDHEYGGSFEYVDDDECIMKELYLPDHTYEYVHRGEEKETLDEWLKDNPGWKQDEYGHWYNEEQQERINKYFEDQKELHKQLTIEDFGVEVD